MVTDLISEALQSRGTGAQTRLAEAIGVAVQTVNKWVKHQTAPELHRLPAIEEALDMPPGTLTSAAGVAPDQEAGILGRLARIEARLDRLERGSGRVIRLDERANRQLHDDPPARPHAAGSPGDDLTADDLDAGSDTHLGGADDQPEDFE